ncbi:MAG: UDP-2,3-diacylglucosamine diphosphatase LpxI [Thermoguttaceae bacterium]|nr:UDP-2,3-diacylglucosamine diphosphatase LpxI [Thermoguttaceae bacterium]
MDYPRESRTNPDDKTIGLIAGWGNYPITLVRALKADGYKVVCIGVHNHADPVLAELCDVFRYSGLAKFGRACGFFRRHHVNRAVMAGKIFKELLLQPGFIFRQLPDPHTIRTFLSIFFSPKTDFNSDTLLLASVRAFEQKGIHLIPATDLVPSFLLGRGRLTDRPITPRQWDDIRCAWPLTREIGRLDIGQMTVVQDKRILAIEGVGGTDRTARRGVSLGKSGDVSIIKIGKPNQDMRFDVPTMGMETLKAMVKNGISLLAMEAGRTIMIEPPEELARFANEHGLTIVALRDEDRLSDTCPFDQALITPVPPPKEEPVDRTPPGAGKSVPFTRLTRRRPSAGQAADLNYGWPYARALGQYGVGRTVLIRKRSVIEVETIEGVEAAVARGKESRCPGALVLVYRIANSDNVCEPLGAGVIEAMKDAKATLLAVDESYPMDRGALAEAADRAGIVFGTVSRD